MNNRNKYTLIPTLFALQIEKRYNSLQGDFYGKIFGFKE